MNRSTHRSWFWLCLTLLTLALYGGLATGTVSFSPVQLLQLLLDPQTDPLQGAVLWQIRLPRVLLASLVGSSLAVSGAVFQAVLRNPLADPYLLGVSGGAALGAVTAICLGMTTALWLPLSGFLGALFALWLVYLVARAHQASTHTLILAGVMVGSLATAVLLFLLWRIPADPLRSAVFWLAGNLSGASPAWLPWGSLVSLIASLLVWSRFRLLDVLTQGEDVAADLGVDVGRARQLLFVAAGFLVATAVSLAGLVGFVGLVVPHVVRLLWGPSHVRLIPAAALCGAAFLVVSDAVARSVFSPAEIPVGVVTALIGAPFFLYLLRNRGGL
ncbi:MAG: iron ABC transporter permease [Desulfuromonadaceae bacterium]|nr:iron ABC transporter permease [Desulfuromonadaceae bacterium]